MNKTILITGGTGSFGNAYLQKAIEHDIFSEIIIFSRDEKKQNDQRKLLNNDRVPSEPTNRLDELKPLGSIKSILYPPTLL